MASSIQPQAEPTFLTLDASKISLINDNKTATRNHKEWNHGVVFSSSPLQNDRVFRVQIDKKISNRTGSIQMGVITCEPSVVEMNGSASSIINGAWVLAGNIILRNGTSWIHVANKDLNDLAENETCGVMRTSNGELIFELNGECLGIIAQNLPPRIYAVIDLNGKCVQITLQPTIVQLDCSQHNNDKTTRSCPVLTPNVPLLSNLQLRPELNVSVTLPLYKSTGQGAIPKDKIPKNNKLRFHQHCGNLVKLSADRKTAERRDPLDEFNNGVVMTHRSLFDDELFEIRIDHLVNKWSGSLEVGVTTHNPLLIEFPTTMTNMHSGTIVMSGCGILINGKGTRREYGQFNLDKLREGDRVGMMRKSNGNLHYFINGLDQGIAASKIPQHVWGVIDLYGMTIKVTVIDPDERKNQTTLPLRKSSQSNFSSHADTSHRNNVTDIPNTDRLLFHSNCGAHAVVSNGGLTAHRPRATDDFNNGVVLTNRPLHPDEVFEVRLDKVVKKWAGSIEIGVTTHPPTDLDFPITMTNMRSGTWMMTGNGVMHNGTTVQDRYGSSLDRIIVGDRVGVVRQSCGTLRFYINGIDQGPATTNVPEDVYGVIDLYGQAAQASIVQFPNSPESLPSSISNTTLHGGDLCFNRSHGRNVRIRGMGILAVRLASMVNFEDALIFSSRPLRECEMFQIRVREVLELWDSCLAFGVTAACPNDTTLPSTFKGIAQDTYVLHRRSLIHNGCCVSDKYPLNLMNVSVNSRLGIMRHADRSVHFYLDGMDQGKAWDVYNLNIYAVIDLSGQCSEISMCPPKSRGYSGNSDNSLNMPTTGLQCSHITKHIFSEYCGSNIEINSDYTIARVISLTTMSNLVFSASLLHPDGIFEIEILSCDNNFAGSLRIGVTDVNILNAYVNSKLPPSMLDLPSGTMYIEGNQQITVGSNQVNAICPSLCWLKTKDRVGLRRIGFSDCIALQLNTEEIGVVFRNVPDKVFVVFELCGSQTSIRAISSDTFPCAESDMEGSDDGNSLQLIGCTSPVHTDRINDNDNMLRADSPDHMSIANINNNDRQIAEKPFGIHKKSFFHINHGGNIVIEKHGIGVRRLTGYNRAIVIASKPIIRGQSFKFQITKTNLTWNSSIMIGVSKSTLALRLPTSAVDLNQGCWIVSVDHLYLDGNTVWSDYGKPLDSLRTGSIIALEFTENRELHLIINDVNLGCFTQMTPKINKLYPIIDIYGQCEQISIINEDTIPSFESELDMENMSDNISNASNMCVQPDGVIEHNGNNASSYYKTIQLCEKAYLEYYEKESNSLDRNNFSFGYSSQPSASCINFLPRDKTAKNRLSKSLSENESINLAIQNISITDSANVVNEIRNREIKRRTMGLSVQANNSTFQDHTCSIWSFTPYDDQIKREFALHRSTTLPNIPRAVNTLKRSKSLEGVSVLLPKTLHHLLESNSANPIWHTSSFNDSLVKFWKLWELWKQCKRDALNYSASDSSDLDSPIEDSPRQMAIKNTYLKDSYKLIFNKCRSLLAQSVKDVYESNQMATTSLEICDSSPGKPECILSVLFLCIDILRDYTSAKTSSFSDDYEYYIRILFRERSSRYLPGDDFVYYIRELFREEPPVYQCPLLNRVMKMKESLDLPNFIFTSDPPQCFCNTCCQPEMITDIPNGWVRFFLNKSGGVPPKAKRQLNYWLMNIEDVKELYQVGPEPGLPVGEVFTVPYEKLPSPDLIDNAHMHCFDTKHKIGEMKAALQVLIWHMSSNAIMPPEEYCQTFNIQPTHYHIESVGYCQVTALLLCETI